MVLSKSSIFVICFILVISTQDVYTKYENQVEKCFEEIQNVFLPYKITVFTPIKKIAKKALLYLRISDDQTKDSFTKTNAEGKIIILEDAKAYYQHILPTIVSGTMAHPIHYCDNRKEKRNNEDQLKKLGFPIWLPERRKVLVWIYKHIVYSELPNEADHALRYIKDVSNGFQIIDDTMDSPWSFCLTRHQDKYTNTPNPPTTSR